MLIDLLIINFWQIVYSTIATSWQHASAKHGPQDGPMAKGGKRSNIEKLSSSLLPRNKIDNVFYVKWLNCLFLNKSYRQTMGTASPAWTTG